MGAITYTHTWCTHCNHSFLLSAAGRETFNNVRLKHTALKRKQPCLHCHVSGRQKKTLRKRGKGKRREPWQRDGGPSTTGTSAHPSSPLQFSHLAHWHQQQCARRLSCLLVAVLRPFWLILWLIIASYAISLTFSHIWFCLLVLPHGNSKELSSGQKRRVGQTYWNSWGG